MARRKTNSADTRNKILEVSTRLFADQGYDGVAMRQITKEVGVTLPTVYHHFGSKEELFKAVEEGLYASHARSLIDDIHEDVSPEERLRNFMNNLIGQFEANPDYFRLVQRNLVDNRAENHKYLVKISFQSLYDELRDTLNAVRNGAGDDLGPILVFSSVIGFLTMRPAVQALKGYPYKRQRNKERERLIDVTVNAVKTM